jgi:hypothetical protein
MQFVVLSKGKEFGIFKNSFVKIVVAPQNNTKTF